MDNSSGEDLIIKTRKPYTITKQREKWTEEEHNRFLEALKLYGRAWQRIEEHIGTKTAVQIRSHAQKFFSKLEKEALTKGIPLGQAHGIEIPPPRPKRKPNNPYPRKTFVGVVPSSGEGKNDGPLTSGSSLCSNKKVFDMEMDTSHEDTSCAFTPPANEGPTDACNFREFIPLEKENKVKTADDEYSPIIEGNKELDKADMNIGRFEVLSIDTQIKLTQERSAGLKQLKNLIASPKNKLRCKKSHTEHNPEYSIDGQSNINAQTTGSGATGITSLSNQAGSHAYPNMDTTPCISATNEHHTSTSMSSVHPPFAAFPPFNQFCSSQDAYRSFLNMSSTFSSLIMLTLLQNPAVHATASLAASFWPAADVDTSMGSTSETFVGGIPVRHMNSSPSMAAIAAATVAAASAWWATHGLLPFCHPAFHGGFTIAQAPAASFPGTEPAPATEESKQEKDVTQDQTWRDQQTFGLEFSAPTLQPSPLSLSDSDESREGGRSQNIMPKCSTVNQMNPMPDSGLLESDKARNQKKVDPSSCGSNTASSSEVETDIALENPEKDKEETKEAHLSHPLAADASNRRLRGGGNVGEFWKEVSQEGRIAFQALFSREVLPQSFSPPHTKDGMTEKAKEGKEAAALTVDINHKVCGATDVAHFQGLDKNYSTPKDSNMGQGLLTNEIGPGKLKSRRTGFKPYKRCSMEVKESRAAPMEEKENKRIRLEGESLDVFIKTC